MPNQDPVALRNTINRPQATTWAVPLDDAHTMQIGYYRAPEGKEPSAVPCSARTTAGRLKSGNVFLAIGMPR